MPDKHQLRNRDTHTMVDNEWRRAVIGNCCNVCNGIFRVTNHQSVTFGVAIGTGELNWIGVMLLFVIWGEAAEGVRGRAVDHRNQVQLP